MSLFTHKKDGLLLKDDRRLKAESGNMGKWQSSKVLQNDAFFGGIRV